MSGNHPRTLLRETIVAILSNQGRPAYPTMAEGRVYDSKADPVMDGIEGKPYCLVYTDSTEAVFTAMNNPWPFNYCVQVCIELGYSSEDTETEASVERMIDDFEMQVQRALFDPTAQTGQKFNKVVQAINSYETIRLASHRNNNRMAGRVMIFEVKVRDKCPDISTLFPPLETIGINAQLNGADEPIQNVADNLQD